MSLYEPGEDVVLIGDIFPGTITPYPAELPHTVNGEPQSGLIFRVLITGRGLVVGWQAGGVIHRAEIEADTSGATFRGGQVGPYTVTLNGSCRCQARMLSAWDKSQIFPGSMIQQQNTLDAAIENTRRDANYGLIPQRYSRA